MPIELSNLALAIEQPFDFVEEHPEWQIYKDYHTDKDFHTGFNVLTNEEENVAFINFLGFDGNVGQDNVYKNIPFGRHKELFESEDMVNTSEEISTLMRDLTEEGYDVQFSGHSYGGFKSRYFAGLYDRPSHNFNAHWFPWNRKLF